VIVVDASVVANVVGDDGRDGEVARDRLGQESELAAPDLVDVETLAVLRRRWLAGGLTNERFHDAVALLVVLPIERHAALGLIPRAAELRSNVTAYDAMYVALAEQLGCTLLTGDARLASAAGVDCPVEVLRAG